jgi:hypothetical protein
VPKTQSGISRGRSVINTEARILTVQDGEWLRPKAACAEDRNTRRGGASGDGDSVCPHGEVALALPSGVG